MPIEKRPDHDPEHHGSPRRKHGSGDWDHDDFFGLDVQNMSPRAQVVTSLAVLIPVAIGAALVLTLGLWWLIFFFGWAVFPAFGLMVRGIAGLSEGGGPRSLPGNHGERDLLEALRKYGELTPAQAAMETSLTVAEADDKLKELAKGGHLEVRVRGGGLFYALWDHDAEARRREFENPL